MKEIKHIRPTTFEQNLADDLENFITGDGVGAYLIHEDKIQTKLTFSSARIAGKLKSPTTQPPSSKRPKLRKSQARQSCGIFYLLFIKKYGKIVL